MTPWSFVLHIAGFVMPALGVALVLWLGLRVRRVGRSSAAAAGKTPLGRAAEDC